jgi:hypothetical protein
MLPSMIIKVKEQVKAKSKLFCRLTSIGVAEMDAVSWAEKADGLYQDGKFEEVWPQFCAYEIKNLLDRFMDFMPRS